MGVGSYTEQDIKEAARAFTGWTFSHWTGEYVFAKGQHDDGEKTFLGIPVASLLVSASLSCNAVSASRAG